MELVDFVRQTQAEVKEGVRERMGSGDGAYPYLVSVFAEVVMKHMSEVGMTFDEPTTCHVERVIGNANVRLNGYAVSEEGDQLDLFVCLYSGTEDATPIPDSETKTAASQCVNLLARCVDGRLARNLDKSDEAYPFATTVQEIYGDLDQIRIYVITDRVAKTKSFKSREVSGKLIKLEVMDIERLHRHWSEGKPRDEIVINFTDMCGGPLPCVYVRNENAEYDYALAAMPAEALRFVYDRYGGRLLEANVRSFLSATGKVNRGIRDTLKQVPERFMAYNNGIVLVADEAEFGKCSDGSLGILWLQGMQIVNGGQTTASIYFSKKKDASINLTSVRVASKILILRGLNAADEEALISDISRYSNSQNSVRQSDLSANKPFHIELERLSMTTYCPDGVGRWFYERAAGSYHVLLAREGTTPARLRTLKEAIPSGRRVTKTDLAKYLNAWAQLPHVVGLGAQKNFERFMQAMSERESASDQLLPDSKSYKEMIAKAILYKRAVVTVRPLVPAFQANVTAYLVSLIAFEKATQFSWQYIWDRQSISNELVQLMAKRALEVNDTLQRSAMGRMISEWAKKEECWNVVRTTEYSPWPTDVPELL
jgi:hypothetical protein